MCGLPASALWCGQPSPPVATCPHNGAAPHREPDFMGPTRLPSSYSGSNQQPNFIPRRDPARNQHPGSTFYGLHPPVHIDGPNVQRALFRDNRPAAFPPRGPRTVAPGGNPFGNQNPGTNTWHSPRHGMHHHNRNSDPYPQPLHLFPGQQNVGRQQDNRYSNALHQWDGVVPAWPTPSTTDGHGFVFPQWPMPAAVAAPPQGSHINEVAPSPFMSNAPIMIPEAASPVFSLGTPPASAPPSYTESSPNESQSTTRVCPDPTCKSDRSWGRNQELERHVLKHLPHHIGCPHPYCSWTGSRRYALKEHYKRKHMLYQVPDLGTPEAFTIYNAKLLAKRLVNGEITLPEAIKEADVSVREKAGQVGHVRRTTI